MPSLQIHVTMPDGSVWQVPARVVVDHQIAYFKEEGQPLDAGYVERLRENRLELHEWGKGDMDWKDVADQAVCISPPPAVDFQEGWVNGKWEFVEAADAPAITPVQESEE